jgi:hypothetical protein
MTVVESIPDWQGSISQDNFTILPAYGGGNQYFILPLGVHIRQKENGKPDFYLNFFCPQNNYNSPEHSIYTMINIGLEKKQGIMEQALMFLRQQKPQATLIPVKFSSKSFWNLEIPTIKPIVEEFAWEDADTIRVYQRIPENVGLIIYQGLQGKILAARAAVQCEVVAFVPRFPVRVTFKTSELLTALRDLDDNKFPNMSYFKIRNFLVEHRGNLPLSFDKEYNVNESSKNFALALMGHIRMKLGSFISSPSIAEGPQIAFKDPSDTSLPKEMVWDLSTPLMAATPLMFTFDPFTEVLKIVDKEGVDAFTYFSKIPSLPSELTKERVFIAGNLPPNLQDVLRVDVTLRVESQYAPHGNVQTETATIFPVPVEPLLVELKFKHPDQKKYNVLLTVITQNGIILHGNQFDHTGDYLYIGTRNFPTNFLTVRATEILLSQAELDVTITDSDGNINKTTLLNAGQPTATFMLLEPSQKASLKVVARSLTDMAKTLSLYLPAQPVQLDLFSFPEFGVQTIEVTTDFQTGTDSVVFEFLPEGSTNPPIIKKFTRDNNQQQLIYHPKTLFEYRYQYRRKPTSGSAPMDWSDYQSPLKSLTLTIG